MSFAPSHTGRIAIGLAVAGLFVSWDTAHAANIWTGAGSGGTNTDVDLTTNWDDSIVPVSGNSALFNWTTNTGRAPIVIPSTATFAPSQELRFYDSVINGGSSITLQKSLSFQQLTVRLTGTSGGTANNRFIISDGTTLNLSGDTPIDLTQGFTGWHSLQLGVGGSDSNVTINLTSPTITFNTLTGTGNTNVDGATASMSGGATNSSAGAGPSLNFTAVGGSVELASGGLRQTGTLSVGRVNLGVRSDQTWTNPSGLGFISVSYSGHDGGTSGTYVVDSIDGGALNNLDAVNLRLTGDAGSASFDVNEAMRFRPGEYGGLRWDGGGTSIREHWTKLTGNVAFTGQAVVPGRMSGPVDPVASNDSLVIVPGTGGTASQKNMSLEGFNLSLGYGFTIDDAGNPSTTSIRSSLIVARNTGASQLMTVGGDVTMRSTSQDSAARSRTNVSSVAYLPTRSMGIDGGASGNFTLRVGGNFSTNLMSNTNATYDENLAYSTLYMLGGTTILPVTWEVGDANSATGIGIGKFAVGTFNVGDLLDPASLQLVNAYINNNPLSVGEDPDVNKVGEKLIAGNLNIAAGSTLDVNGLNVEVVTGLGILPTGMLNLNSGAARTGGYRYENFVGLGDQTLAWSALTAFVSDSDSPGESLEAILHTDGNTYWQVAIPEPASLSLVGMLGAGLLRRRRA